MKKKRKTKPRIYVELTAVWGNDDVDSTIKVSRRRWQQIQDGAEYSHSVCYCYEGERYSAYWHFAEGKVSIGSDDGMECVVDAPVNELLVYINTPD